MHIYIYICMSCWELCIKKVSQVCACVNICAHVYMNPENRVCVHVHTNTLALSVMVFAYRVYKLDRQVWRFVLECACP